MSTHRIATLASAVILIILAALALYRLLAGFPITIGGMEVGQTMSFFAFVVFAALGVMLLRSGRDVAH